MLEQRLLPLLWPEQGGEASAGGAAPPDIGAGQQSPEISTLKDRINNKNNPDNLLRSLFDLGELLPWII
jgi:hypothetical protein